jgi:hypothetical protein
MAEKNEVLFQTGVVGILDYYVFANLLKFNETNTGILFYFYVTTMKGRRLHFGFDFSIRRIACKSFGRSRKLPL